MPLIYALLSGTFYTISALIQRYLLKDKTSDSWAYSFWFSTIGVIVTFPFLLLDIQLEFDPIIWLVMLGVGMLVMIHNYLNIGSLEYISPALQGALNKTRLFWIFLLGIIFLSDEFHYTKLIGVMLTLLSGFIISKSFKAKLEKRGILMALLATVFYSIVITSYSILDNAFNAAGITFFIFLIPVFLNLIFMPNSINRVKLILKENTKELIIANVFGALGFLTLNQALISGDNTEVIVITESFLIITLGLEHIILKDQKKLPNKIIAVILALAGAVIIKISI